MGAKKYPAQYFRALVNVLAVLSVSFDASGSPGISFESALQRAEATIRTDKGARYDRELGSYFFDAGGVQSGMSECLSRHPGPHHLEGFFSFETTSQYKLELIPRNEFASCLAAVYQGRNPPPPPFLPYFNHFRFIYPD
jgi:hypothetical protein